MRFIWGNEILAPRYAPLRLTKDATLLSATKDTALEGGFQWRLLSVPNHIQEKNNKMISPAKPTKINMAPPNLVEIINSWEGSA
ncbi:hypothetical protein BEUL_0834 [Bifidobacterium eulemuris]|uniref:Uncharacterized protein n=1 Tax=Bifidobacterium eulemuris TaxID=1765219 RepID=A0A261GDC4_9BIFI|nr:hypothetical protein BEUL_0834 [Bifidobacterium eulemuris]